MGQGNLGVCNGSYICENPECTKILTEGVQKQEKGRGYTCNAVDTMPTRGTVDASRSQNMTKMQVF